MKPIPCLLPLPLAACSGGAEPETSASPAEETSGGEAEVAEEPPPPMVLRTTTPVPVPQPAVQREALSETLQTMWTRVEEIVAMRPPEPPAESTLEAIEAWAQGPFREWLTARRSASQEVETLGATLVESESELAVAERAVGAALFGYLYEDLASGARGAPVPDEIADDAELLTIYAETLTQSVQPIARAAFDAYVFCAEHVATELAETPWASWGPYCYGRANEVNEVFAVAPSAETSPDEPAPEGSGEEGVAPVEGGDTESGDAEPGETSPVSARPPSGGRV